MNITRIAMTFLLLCFTAGCASDPAFWPKAGAEAAAMDVANFCARGPGTSPGMDVVTTSSNEDDDGDETLYRRADANKRIKCPGH